MKRKFTFFLTTLLLIFVGCSEEVVKIDEPTGENAKRTIKVMASVGGNDIGTRVAMQQNGFDLNLTWEVGDVIWLVFNDGENFVHSNTTVTAVSNNGKRAEFEVEVPEGSDAETFNLYGYYGGGQLTGSLGVINSGDLGIVNLQSAPWEGPLPALENADLVMLRFAAIGLDMESPEISVTFQHVGSLFKIFLENTSTTPLQGVTNVQIFSETDPIYAYQPLNTAQYDVINGEFVDGSTTTYLNELTFLTVGADDVGPSEVLELWGWYPPSQESDHSWPALKLRLTYVGGELVTTDTKPARSMPTAIGRVYHFYATFDGTELSFSDVYKQKLIDSRDQSQYNTIVIGGLTWMAENLRFYPLDYTIGGGGTGSITDPFYYVYGYDGVNQTNDILQNMNLSGVLYNWSAALDGAGICPEGWHIPSELEWQQLITAVGADPGIKLKDPLWWQTGGAVGTNGFGFTARPGGIRTENAPFYFNIGANGYWLTSDIVSATEMKVASIANNENEIEFLNVPRDFAVSVRCVRD